MQGNKFFCWVGTYWLYSKIIYNTYKYQKISVRVLFAGDSGYPLRATMMTPILNTTPGTPEHFYYNIQVTARNTVERCIGVLKARFRFVIKRKYLLKDVYFTYVHVIYSCVRRTH